MMAEFKEKSIIFIIYTIILFLFPYSSDCFSDDHHVLTRKKRTDIDLQTCIDNFDIHRDKIIRTQDSQRMGAKYLNEIDLGTREECLRLCCETENCDVFVFEEKNSGSCYLFQCGPPEDFKCKFTHHVNYSSAVLAISRHLPDLESQIKLTKHEQDLNKLRKSDLNGAEILQQEAIIVQTTTTTIPSTTIKSKEIIPIETINLNTKRPDKDRKCSRYQFECKSTNECIAIYNACDGIPQCADGSDEAPELSCPDTITTPLPVIQQPQQQQQQQQQQQHLNDPITPPKYDISSTTRLNPLPPVLSQPEMYRPQLSSSHEMLRNGNNHVQSNNIGHQPEDFIRPNPNLNPPPQPPHIPYDNNNNNNQMLQYSNTGMAPQQLTNTWIPHQSNQMPLNMLPYTDKNSHIFNHKEVGLQVPDGQEIRYNNYKGAMQLLHRTLGVSENNRQLPSYSTNDGNLAGSGSRILDYGKIPNYYNYRQTSSSIQQQEPWPINRAQDNQYQQQQQQPYPIENSNKDYHPDNIPQGAIRRNEESSYKSTGYEHNNNNDWKQPQLEDNTNHEQSRMAHELKHTTKDNKPEPIIDNKHNNNNNNGHETKIKIEKHKHNNHHDQYPDVVAYKLDGNLDLQDGVAETPGGAVLSLTLGLIITCIMALLIACRLRVKRRIRKGGKSYAHDADYLVNGMYL